ncbi:putative cyclin-dependent serine/threonine-protein kinase DDB_G0272797/DDB_G0274007 [Anastrepha ludens]|uniref:putative cyclin-dependent serine/threonine-protein kinase DDB_G0272797/DDB_G0274007 n=1 Tax=Anastrepha ludens TaxID=28586 RepID=UPI0023B06745|nr:putative cyclin-dependent serine/threonine-protein kinase DDB_G0272797/DDB_G0274007 [Anastrepha ludens]XP_053969337.1 putative cyclin-dependent serine/threonine-protein kinase DDB_G0272797/DDB_G0274007 [Anastrepha ludens]
MDLATVPPELEELLICSCCHLPFNDNDALPKLFTCRHYFCLKCVNSLLREGSDELYCVHCWKRTELQGPEPRTDSLPTYNAILYLTQNLTSLSLKMKTGERDHQQRSSSIASNGSTGALSGSGALNSSANNNNNSNNDGSNSNISSIGVGVGNSNNNSVDKLKMTENCMTHAMPNTLWCSVCNMLLCRACAATEEHRSHLVKNKIEAKESLRTDISNELLGMQKTLNDVQHLVLKQRDFLLKILESCTTLKTQIETELINHMPTLEISEIRDNLCKARLCLEMLDKQTPAEAMKLYTTLHGEKQRLMAKYQEMFLQCKLDDMIRNCGYVFDFDLIKQALVQMHNCVLNGGNLDNFGVGSVIGGLNGITGTHHQNPVLLLANYCISQLYSRHMLVLKQQQQQQQHQQQQQQQHAQQQQHQQQQQHLLSNGLLTSMISHVSLANSINGNIPTSNANFTHATYAQALQQNQPASNSVSQQQQQQQQQLQANNPSSPVHKTYADIIALSNKSTTNLQNAQQQQQLLQQQQSTGSSFSEIAPIGTPATTSSTSVVVGAQRNATSHLFSSNDLNGLGLSLLHLQQQTASNAQQQQSKSTLLLNPSVHVYPIYYFNIEINGQHSGRILIEVRSDVAPKMAKNFNALATQELGYGYKGCHIFQCWENESIITGDFELNNGRGGRSVYDEGFFMPDDTKILAIRGSVGMRRSQKRHDNLGLVGSQFRIILREMRGFTGIFAFVVEGLDLVEKISQTGDATGKPQSSVVIVSCGKYQLG